MTTLRGFTRLSSRLAVDAAHKVLQVDLQNQMTSGVELQRERLSDGFDVLSGLYLFQEHLGKPQLLEVQGIFNYQQAHFVDMLGFEGLPCGFEQSLIIGEGHRNRRPDGTTTGKAVEVGRLVINLFHQPLRREVGQTNTGGVSVEASERSRTARN